MNFNNQYRIFYFIILFCVPLSIYFAASMSLWWWLLGSFIWTKIINFVFLQIGLHRYFAHDSFATTRFKHNLLAYGSLLTGHGSPITWSTHHLYHHRVSDQPNDLHSPRHGLWHTALFWPIKNEIYFSQERCVGYSPKRLVKDKNLLFIHKNYFIIWIALVVLLLVVDWRLALYGLLAPAGWSVLHGNIVTNLLSHYKIPGSYRTFNTNDQSYNNKYIQLFQFGEGLHNNHHHNMRDYNQAMLPGEWDPAAWVIDKFFKVIK